MHDVKNITYSFLFLVDEHGCLLIVGLDDLHAFSKDCNKDPYQLFDGPIDTTHITHLVYMKPEEAEEAISDLLDKIKSGKAYNVVIPAYLQADVIAARETGELPPGWYPVSEQEG